MEGMITLTMKEQRRNDVIVRLINKTINAAQAGKLLGLSKRQIKRIKKRFLADGIKSVIHKNKNKPTGKGHSNELKNKILFLYNSEYFGWNFHHFNDTLHDYHNIIVSNSFIYSLLTKNGIASPYKYKQRKKSHPPRNRKENAGELVQMDASKHQWFYNDNSYYHLHGAIDDATGTVTGSFFQKEETTYGYQNVLLQMFKIYGLPECLYTDYRTIFASTKKELTLDEELEGKKINTPKFIKMLKNLGISNIPTRNPMAKGRIERLWKTFQSRLYNEMKKKNIKTIEEANLYLLEFIPKYNAKFALPIDNTKNIFVRLEETFNYNMALSTYDEYSIHRYCYLSFKGTYRIILDVDNNPVYINTKSKVKVITLLDQSIVIEYNNIIYSTRPVLFIPKNQVAKEKKEVTKSRTSKQSVSPWRKGLPPMPSKKCIIHAYLNAS